MAKSRKHKVAGPPAIVPDVGAPRYSGETTAGNADRERIAERAYQLYIERGGRHGKDLDDWLEAERELARRGSKRTSRTDSGV